MIELSFSFQGNGSNSNNELSASLQPRLKRRGQELSVSSMCALLPTFIQSPQTGHHIVSRQCYSPPLPPCFYFVSGRAPAIFIHTAVAFCEHHRETTIIISVAI